MLDSPFELITLVVAIAAFAFARKAQEQVARLRERLDTLEATGVAPAARPAPPPLPQFQQAPPSAAAAAPEPAPDVSEPETAPSGAETAASAVRPSPVEPGFEERIGTRWVVWIGGVTLALGGFFMVRYSIEAGLLGPRVRVALGGLFALALLGAGEWTRRKESIADIVGLPIADIPAILTAAGTAVAFATVYAAYALYGFLARSATSGWKSAGSTTDRKSSTVRPPARSNTPIPSRGSPSAWCCWASEYQSIRSAHGLHPLW
jgi:uncharacterized membrane protein